MKVSIWWGYQSALIQRHTEYPDGQNKCFVWILTGNRISLIAESGRVSVYFCFLSEFACFCNLTSPALAYQPPTQGTVITGEIITGVINMSVFCFGNNLIRARSEPPLFVFYLSYHLIAGPHPLRQWDIIEGVGAGNKLVSPLIVWI